MKDSMIWFRMDASLLGRILLQYTCIIKISNLFFLFHFSDSSSGIHGNIAGLFSVVSERLPQSLAVFFTSEA